MITFAGPILSSVNTHEVNKVLYYPRCVQHSSDVLSVQLLVHHSHWPWLQLRWCSCHTSAAGSCARYNYMVKILKWKLLNSLFFQISGMFFSIGQCFTLHDCCPYTVEGDNKCGVCCGRYILPLSCINIFSLWQFSRLKHSGKMCLAIIFSILGFLSLAPALLWTFIYKWFTSFDVKTVMLDYANDT